jgi:hypothetical protein
VSNNETAEAIREATKAANTRHRDAALGIPLLMTPALFLIAILHSSRVDDIEKYSRDVGFWAAECQEAKVAPTDVHQSCARQEKAQHNLSDAKARWF